MAKAIMIQGTMSNAGKSLLAAGLCRILRQDGYRVAPFKSQNMALNSYITRDGLEMGRAQVAQAEAAGIEPEAAMNPILLKPTTDMGSQVIVNGIPVGSMDARDYFTYKKTLAPEVKKAYEYLASTHDIMVIEGAGSPAEINLKQDDIVNMGMARMAGAPVLLAGDIDRGGVFAQLYGTVMLLPEEERALIKGMIINKFRGDKTILDPGTAAVEKLCGLPVVGVVPYMADVDIDDEDSLSSRLEPAACRADALADIAVIRLPRISNFTDFQVFSCIPGITLRYVKDVSSLGRPDLILLPGTKSTIADLLWMRQNGLESAVKKLYDAGIPVFGICGGYQMMGESVLDEQGVEAGPESAGSLVAGMGLLPVRTVFENEKTRVQVSGSIGTLDGIFHGLSGMVIEGYEIHMGKSCRAVPPLSYVLDKHSGSKAARMDGCHRGNAYGTYVHGFFDADGVARAVVKALLEKKGNTVSAIPPIDRKAYKETQYDRLAAGLRASLDMEQIYKIIENGI